MRTQMYIHINIAESVEIVVLQVLNDYDHNIRNIIVRKSYNTACYTMTTYDEHSTVSNVTT